MNIKKITSSLLAVALVANIAIATPAFADDHGLAQAQPEPHGMGGPKGGMQFGFGPRGTSTMNAPHPGMGGPNADQNKMRKMNPVVFGTVSSVSGNILTVTAPLRPGFGFGMDMEHMHWNVGTSTATTTPPAPATSTAYTVDATNAKIFKNNATATVANISVGDSVFVQGAPNASSTNTIIASTIYDVVVKANKGGDNDNKQHPTSTPPSLFQDNGQPIVIGTVSAIGTTVGTSTGTSTASTTVTAAPTTITVTSQNIVYTVDLTNAKIVSGNNASSTIANIAVGDKVLVQGTVTGTSIAASTLVDQNQSNPGPKKPVQDFFRSIGSFFSRFFHF